MKTTRKTSRKPGRPRAKAVWHASQAQFCVATGKSREDVRRAARDPFAGKKYFRQSRVWSELEKWMDENPMPANVPIVSEKERLQAEKLLKENRKLDLEHQMMLGKYMPIEAVKASWDKGMEIVQKVMLTFLDKGVYNKAIREMKRELEGLDL